MLIIFLSNIIFNRFINFINNIFSSKFFLIFIFSIISILIRISFLKTKSIKNINNNFTKFAIISFIFTFIRNLSNLLILNIFIQFSFGWIKRSTINLLNFIFLLSAIFLSATKTKYFNFIVLFNKLIAIFFLIIFAPVIFNFIFDAFLKTENNSFYLILWMIGYGSLISTIVINNSVMEVKQIFRILYFGFILLLLCLILNLYFIENTNDIKLSTSFKNIFMIILLWIYIWNVVLINKNNTKTQNQKKNNEDLKFFVLAIKNNCLIMDKPIKYTTIFINGYKQVMII